MVSTRRARQAQLQNETCSLQEPVEPIEADRSPNSGISARRRSAQVAVDSTESAGGGAGRSKTAGQPKVEPKSSKSKKAKAAVQINSEAKNYLCSLPPEILSLALNNVKDVRSMSALGRTCKALYSMMTPRLYRSVTVAAMFHAHIPKLIRTLEPHLTIAQKKMLKKEGAYKGQQQRYPTGLDERAKPFCASYVRQLVVGVADPGKKHKYIVDRYIEELLKNLDNLEILETRVLTESIAKSIASLKTLKALSLFVCQTEDMAPLANVKNLEHLSIHDTSWSSSDSHKIKITRSLLRNSASTLESLVIHTDGLDENDHLFSDWANKAPAGAKATTPKTAVFTALKSLSLSSSRVETQAIQALQRAVDFTKLTELTIGDFEDKDGLLFRDLAALAATRGPIMGLRHLSLSMADGHHFNTTPEENRARFEARCQFISSFNSLATLELHDYGQYPENVATNPGLKDILLQAILRHSGLTALRISYRGKMGGLAIPYLSADTVGTLVRGLPRLQEFEFAPDEGQMDEIGQSLAQSINLSSITCFPPFADPELKILSGIIKSFLDCAGNTPFVWENRYKLKRVSVSQRTWDIASEFSKKGDKGMKKPEQMKSEDGKRIVSFRDITGTFPVYIHVGYDPNLEWVKKVGGA